MATPFDPTARGRVIPVDLGAMVAREDVASPAAIMAGEVVEMSDAEDRLARWVRVAEDAAA